MTEIYQHIMEPPSFTLKEGDVIENYTFTPYGSEYGRFIFTEHSAPLRVPDIRANVSIKNCHFNGFKYGIEVDEVGYTLNEVIKLNMKHECQSCYDWNCDCGSEEKDCTGCSVCRSDNEIRTV